MHEYFEYLTMILLCGVIGFVFLWVAAANGYFRLPPPQEKKSNPVSFKTVLIVFAIYLGMTVVIAPLLVWVLQAAQPARPSMSNLGWLQLFILASIFLLFYLYCNAQSPGMFGKIWKNRHIPHPQSVGTDVLMGVISWVIAFPLVLAVGQLTDMLLYFFFSFENYEQVAVHYLKTTLASPEMLTIALFTILVAAPIIEEFLFRGCLQTFFKRHMTPQSAIILSALCFSLFHYAPSQGVGNISLVASLFVFALFLGFIYERQASLPASIGLHMTFNTVSTVRILFFPE